jgi:general stress protein 26
MTTVAEKNFLSYKEKFSSVVLTTNFNNRPVARIVEVYHHSNLGFFTITYKNSQKVIQIQKNPYTTLSFFPGSGMWNIVANCTTSISNNEDEIKNVWNNNMKKYGFINFDDKNISLLKFTIHSVTKRKEIFEGVPIPEPFLSFEISNFDFLKISDEKESELSKHGYSIINNAVSKNHLWHLITCNGLRHEDRLLEVFIHPMLGFWTFTHGKSKKVNEVKINPNVCLFLEELNSGRQVCVDALIWIDSSLDHKKLVWKSGDEKYGFNGVNDPNLILFRYTFRSVSVHPPFSESI